MSVPENGSVSSEMIVSALGEFPADTIIDINGVANIFNRVPTSILRAVNRGELPPPVKMFGKSCWTADAILRHIRERLEKARKNAERESERVERLL